MIKGNRDAVSVMGATLAARGISLVMLVALARVLSPRQFGQVATLVAVLGLASLVADFGTAERVVQTTGPGLRGCDSRLRARVTLSAFTGVLIALSGLVWRSTSWPVSVLIVGATVPMMAVITNGVIIDRAARHPLRAVSWNGVFAVAPLVGALAGALLVPSLDGSAIGVGVVTGLAALAAAITHKSQLRPAPLRLSARVAWDARHFAVLAVCVAMYSRGDRLVLAAITGAEAAGVYAAFYTLVFGFSVLGPALAWTSLPILTNIADQIAWRTAVWSRLRLALAAGAALAVLFVAAARAIALIAFGPEYAIPVPALIAFAVLTFLYIVNPVVSAAVLSRGGQGYVSRVAVVNVLVAVATYPVGARVAGVTGIAIASMAVELVGMARLGNRVRSFVGAGLTQADITGSSR